VYESPAHFDVAEFMGYRNQLAGKVTALDDKTASITIGDVVLTGVARDGIKIGDHAVLAARADDVVAGGAGNAIAANVETIEYRGREFVGTARTAEGLELVFHSPISAAIGAPLQLGVDPARALVFAA